MRPTAPSPIFGMKDEFARDWIPMHVVQFLLQFLLAPHIEVIEAAAARKLERPVALEQNAK